MNNRKKPSRTNYDLIVIGSGAAGSVAAQHAAQAGKKVCIVESGELGGDSPRFGVIPTKALLEAAKTLNVIQKSHQFGIRASAISFNYRSVQAFKEKAINSTGFNKEVDVFKNSNITVIRGRAHFINPWTISVGVKHLSSQKFLISSGTLPYVPQIPGIADAGYITYRQAVDLPKPPKSLFIIGGGSVSYEFAQIFAEFGSRVYIAEQKDHLLPKEDPEVGDSAEAVLTEMGVQVYTSTNVTSVSGNQGRKIINLEQKGRHLKINTEEVMVACGKIANTNLGLINAKVKYSANGIGINSHLQTSQKHIYAAGEVTGLVSSAHGAIQQASIVAHNLYARKKLKMDYRAIPRVVYGTPELAMTGYSEHQLVKTGVIYQSAIAPIYIVGKSITSNYSSGFVKLLATNNGVLLGASIVAPYASEMIGELSLAIQHRLHACAITKTVHATPTWSEAIKVAASKIHCC